MTLILTKCEEAVVAGVPSPLQVGAVTTDEKGGFVLTVGVNPAWVEGFCAGVNGVMQALVDASETDEVPEGD